MTATVAHHQSRLYHYRNTIVCTRNCLVSLQLVIQSEAKQVVFLTDELKITRRHQSGVGFVTQLFDTYPIGLVWNSLDFLVYVYLRRKRFTYDEAEYAVRTVNARIGGRSEETINRFAKYTTSLKYLEATKRQIPILW